MKKNDKIIYWVATLWLALGMVSSAVVQLLKMTDEVQMFSRLGYPSHFLTILGVWKIAGVIAILVPGVPLLKEWAYAGFFFVMTGAVCAHLAAGDEPKDFFGPLLLLVLTVVSWHFRPASRRAQTLNAPARTAKVPD